MEKREILGKVIFDYRRFFSNKKVNEYRDLMQKFIDENSTLPNDEFLKKFQQEFTTVDVLHKAFSREYLSRISSDVRTIKSIIVVILILSIIGSILIVSQMV